MIRMVLSMEPILVVMIVVRLEVYLLIRYKYQEKWARSV
jgi:hypothetical protein